MNERKTIKPLQPAQELPELMTSKPMPEIPQANEVAEISAPKIPLELAKGTRSDVNEMLELTDGEFNGVGDA